MDRHAQIEGLRASAARVAIGKGFSNPIYQPQMLGNKLADEQRTGIFNGLANPLAAGHLADGGSPMAVRQDGEVAGEDGPCAPLRFSSMLSCRATGMTRRLVMCGAAIASSSASA